MKLKHLILVSFILFGSLWGLSEIWVGEAALMKGLPRAPILTALAVFFLILTRRLWDVPGSSFALSILAASFKFLQHPFWGCKIAAVLILGATFDIAWSLFREKALERPAGRSAVRSVLATYAAFALFAHFARYVLQYPYWAVPGRMMEYQLIEGSIAAALVIPVTVAGLALARRVSTAADGWSGATWLAYRIAAVGSGIVGAATALALRY